MNYLRLITLATHLLQVKSLEFALDDANRQAAEAAQAAEVNFLSFLDPIFNERSSRKAETR